MGAGSTVSRPPTTTSSPSSPMHGRSSWPHRRRRRPQAAASCASAGPCWPSASAAPTTPTGPRCSRRSCRAGRSRDLLAEMSYYIDVGEQDKALAEQIASDQEVLAAIHQTVVDTATETDDAARRDGRPEGRPSTRASRASRTPRPSCASLEKADRSGSSPPEGDATPRSLRNKANAAKALAAAAAAAEDSSRRRIDDIVRRQAQQGNIPSQYNGTLAGRWPATSPRTSAAPGSRWEPPLGSCAHFHQGIDIVAPYGTPVRAVGRRRRRLHRLELRGRRRPGLDRDHRPQRRTSRPGTPTCSRSYPGNIHAGQHGQGGPGHRLRGQHRPLDRRRTSTGRSSSTGTSSTRGCSSSAAPPTPGPPRRHGVHPRTTPRSRRRRPVLASTGATRTAPSHGPGGWTDREADDGGDPRRRRGRAPVDPVARSAPSRPSRSAASTGSSTSRCRTASTPTSTTSSS